MFAGLALSSQQDAQRRGLTEEEGVVEAAGNCILALHSS